ncbi:MAG: NAD(P)/FAD-dependent oxidoreductase [Candidatus Aenigmatarchaeota archaeon]|nr:MAG: NAD(P)/FAD-dependent oxidoreductase [Candidatus Aenigmarchaeota archaeon]
MYDVIIVGAGPGGCITAKTLEDSGLKVCVLDRKPKNLIGEKVCGDAIGKHHLDFLNRKVGLGYPEEELKTKIRGVKIFSPDRKTFFTTETREGGYTINRLLFGQRLISELGDVNLLADTDVVGIKGRDVIIRREGKVDKIQAGVLVDASGMQAVIRRQIDSPYIEKDIDKRDIAICHREIRDYRFEDQEYCHIYLDQDMSSGGYIWVFPEGGHTNIGLGVKYPINPKERFYHYIKGKPFEDSKIINAGGGAVPVRRTIDSVVAFQNSLGFMFIGDAACQANPIHGGGIGQAMTGGYLAGSVIKKVIDDISLEGLWDYNLAWMKDYGSRSAGLDLFRILLQSLTNKQINFGMKNRLIREEDLLKTSEGGNLELGIADKLTRAMKGITRVNLLNNLRFTANKMQEIKNLYRDYPSPDGFFEWRSRVRKLYQEINSVLKNK